MPGLTQGFQAYSAWRSDVAERVQALRHWLTQNELDDAQTGTRLARLIEQLHEDRLTVAFVAEFSRGKSELINSIFFADYGRRVLPTSAGRTTMCPTELLYDAANPPCVRLLPIETRAKHASVAEYKRFPDEWTVLPLELASPDSMAAALARVCEVTRVPIEEAGGYGLFDAEDPDRTRIVHADGTIDIPSWRHAVINFPHPLLARGLVILDTPGLNAVGAEPELTLTLLPAAHVVLFVLAADTGVTKSDLALWRQHIGPEAGRSLGRLAVLNKIDGLWDGLKSEDEVQGEIDKQLDYCARMLELDRSHIFPVSAQKALYAKVRGDDALLQRSRLPQLERALGEELIPSRQRIVRGIVETDLGHLFAATLARLQTRHAGVQDQLRELESLKGKHSATVDIMMAKVRGEKERFEKGLARFQALRGVLSEQTNRLFSFLGMDALTEEWRSTRERILQSRFTHGVRGAMSHFFQGVHDNLSRSAAQVAEMQSLMDAMYKKFNTEHDLRLPPPPAFAMLKYVKEIERLEGSYARHFDTLMAMLTNGKLTLMQKFFETLAVQVKRCYELANREADDWLRAVMAPMETQVREHQMQLRRRLESIKRIREAKDTLDERIAELQQMEHGLAEQIAGLTQQQSALQQALARDATFVVAEAA
jgi:hypothetical protein